MVKGFLIEVEMVDASFFSSNPYIPFGIDFQRVDKKTVEREVFFCFDRKRLEGLALRVKNIHSAKGADINTAFEILNDFIHPVVAEAVGLCRVVLEPFVATVQGTENPKAVIGSYPEVALHRFANRQNKGVADIGVGKIVERIALFVGHCQSVIGAN